MKFFLDCSLVGRTVAISALHSNGSNTCGLLVKTAETTKAQVETAHSKLFAQNQYDDARAPVGGAMPNYYLTLYKSETGRRSDGEWERRRAGIPLLVCIKIE